MSSKTATDKGCVPHPEKRYIGILQTYTAYFPELPTHVEVIVIPEADEKLDPKELKLIEFLLLSFELRPRWPRLLPHLDSLKVVQTFSAGLDAAARLVPPGVTLCSARGSHDAAVSEWIVAVLLSGYRQLNAFHDRQQEGIWDEATRQLSHGGAASIGRLQGVQGKRVLIIGHGSIGRAVAQRLAPFGVDLVGVARRPRPGVLGLSQLDGQIPSADIIILLAPLLPQTIHLVDAKFLSKTKKGAFIINAGRGQLINTADLEEALAAGRVQAALDVTDPEPLPPGHSLWKAPNLIITPHVGGAVEGWRLPAAKLIRQQITDWIGGRPLANTLSAEGY